MWSQFFREAGWTAAFAWDHTYMPQVPKTCFQPCQSLCTCSIHSSYQSQSQHPISVPPNGVFEGTWVFRLGCEAGPCRYSCWWQLASRDAVIHILLNSRGMETPCTRWVGFIPVFKMAALSSCLILNPPPVSEPQKLGVQGAKMLPHSWAALLELCEGSQAHQPSSNCRNIAVVAQLYLCCKEHSLLCFSWKDRSRGFFSKNWNKTK